MKNIFRIHNSVVNICSFKTCVMIFVFLFLILAPFSHDYYNTANIKIFQDIFYGFTKEYIADKFTQIGWKIDWPYPPISLLITAPSYFVYRHVTENQMIYQMLFKLPVLMAATATGFLLIKIAGENTAKYYFLNPGIILLTSIWGSFDIITGLLVLCAVYSIKSRPYISFAALSLAISLRIYPVVLAPLFILEIISKNNNTKTVLKLITLLICIPILSLLLLTTGNPAFFLKSVLNQQTNFGPIGSYPFLIALSSVIKLTTGITVSTDFLVTLVIVFLIGIILTIHKRYLTGKATLLYSAFSILLVFYALYPKMHAPYIYAVYPISLVLSENNPKLKKNLSAIFIPAIIYALFVNGKGDIRGISYWFIDIAGVVYKTSYNTVIFMTGLVSVIYELSLYYLYKKINKT